MREGRKKLIIQLIILVVIICVFLFLNTVINNKRYHSAILSTASYNCAYQVEKGYSELDKYKIDGWFFLLEKSVNILTGLKNDTTPAVALLELGTESNPGKDSYVRVIRGNSKRTDRSDVNDYFKCEFDYTHSGFEAEFALSDLDLYNKSYQVLIQPEEGTENELKEAIGLNAYIVNGELVYVDPREKLELDVEGTDLEEIVNNGYCLVSRPDYHICIYQYGWKLYWIADTGFDFVKDGTYMQYLLYSTQFDKLPNHRTENGWFWDNNGFIFEGHEVTSEMDCGKYRVSVREIPTEYAINAIELGYHDNGWIWENYVTLNYFFEILM